MTKQDWIRKITSRKFWVAIAGLVAGIIKFMQNPTTDAQAISGLILSFGSVVAYIIGEGLVDAARATDTPDGDWTSGYLVAGVNKDHPPEAVTMTSTEATAEASEDENESYTEEDAEDDDLK